MATEAMNSTNKTWDTVSIGPLLSLRKKYMTVVFQVANRVISNRIFHLLIKTVVLEEQSCSSETQKNVSKSHQSVPVSCSYICQEHRRAFLSDARQLNRPIARIT